MSDRAGEEKEGAGKKKVPFANDGSFLEQFLAMQKQEDATASSSSTAVSKHEEPLAPGGEKKEEEAHKRDQSANQKEKEAVKKVVAPALLGKSLISSFSTKPKKAPQQTQTTAKEPETEDQTKKRKRDEYLAEMAKFRSSSCAQNDNKHSLVK